MKSEPLAPNLNLKRDGQSLPAPERLRTLNEIAISQMRTLLRAEFPRRLQ